MCEGVSECVSVAWGQMLDEGCGRAIAEKPSRMLRAEAVNTLMGS